MTTSVDLSGPERTFVEFFWRDLVGLGLLAAASLGIGLLVNGLRSHPLPLVYSSPKDRLGEVVAQLSAKMPAASQPGPTSSPWRNIELEGFQEFVFAHRGIIIDARPKLFYRTGHVPGALSLPREDFEEGYAGVRALLEAGRGQPIVVYCSEADCKDSELVADALGRLSYRQLFVYKEGWEEWLRAGLPQETESSL